MRQFLVLSLLACTFFSTPIYAAWDIYQSYVIIDSGEGNQYLAGGINAAASSAFDGADLGDFTSSDVLILKGGELLTYKNGSSNVCGGNLQYRLYLSGDVAGSFSAVNLAYDSELGGGNQKWDETGAAIDLLNGLSPGNYFLEVYWDASGSDNDPGGCGDARYDSDSGNNFTASFSIQSDGSANTLIGEFQPNPTGSDPSTVSVELIGGVPGESFDLWLLSIESDGADGRVDRASNVTGSYDAEGRAVVSIDDLENPSHSVVLTTNFSGAEGVDLDPDNDLTVNTSILGTVLDAVGISDSSADDDNLYGEVLGGTDIDYNGSSEPFLVFRDATSGAWYALVETEGSVEAYDAAGDPVDLCGFSVIFSDSFESFGAQNPSWVSANCNGCTDPAYEEFNPSATADDGSCATLASSCSEVEMDGYTYSAVEIGDQCWFSENLRTTVYADGSAIPEVSDGTAWGGLSTGARCDYDNDASNVATYGRLYNWYAAVDAAELCPNGWHVPTHDEWTALEDYVGANGHNGTESAALKSTSGWFDTGNGTDNFGFSALPGGYRWVDNVFNDVGKFASWWSSSPSGGEAFYRDFYYLSSVFWVGTDDLGLGLSVRCLKDADLNEVQGCTNPDYEEFDSSATADDGSCATLLTVTNENTSAKYATIQAAIDAASAGDLITVLAGAYEEDLSFDKGISINGPNAGIAHDGARSAEAIIDGEHTLSAADAVALDGLQFLSNNPAETSTIFISTAAGHTIQNNRFVSAIAGGNTGGQNDKALYTATLSAGSLTISENSFTGDGSFSDGDRYSSAAWGRGLWLNGGGAAVTVSSNDFTNCRTAINLENYANSACSVANNSLTDCGTGFSLGLPTAGEITSITNNSFQDVDTDINAKNLTANIDWNLDVTGNSAIPGNSTFYSTLGIIPGNGPGDIDDPNGYLTYLSGNGEDRLTFGSEDHSITGDDSGAANDYIDGGEGTDRVNYTDNEADVTLTAYGSDLIIATATAGTDTLVNIELLVLADATILLPIGCTDSDYVEYNPLANTDDGSCTTLADPCEGALVLNGVEVDSSATSLESADGRAVLDVSAGTPTSVTFTGINGSNNQTFAQPGDLDNIAAGMYAVTATDASGCESNALTLIMTYALCCECGVSDQDVDGICDNVDNCTDRTAANYDDPSNADCSNAGCMDPAYTEYNASATTDDGSCSTLASTCVPPTMDGYTYSAVEIGDQCWFAENLRTTVYANGAIIPEVTGGGDWGGLSTGARCDYDNDASNVATYGHMYNWHAVNNGNGLCPSGWHVPTDGEWTDLENYINSQGFAGAEGTALKSTSGWNSGTDNFGFSALPGGLRTSPSGYFYDAGASGYWWSSSSDGGNAWTRYFGYSDPGVYRFSYNSSFGFSVRCLRDAD